MLRELTVNDFVLELGSNSAAPGGGSVAALAAAQAAALFEMVARLTVQNKKYEAVREEMEGYIKELEAKRDEFIALIDKDANSFNGVMAAFKLPKETPEEKAARTATIQSEYKNAANVPLSVGLKAMELLSYGPVLIEKGNSNAITDVGVGLLNLKLAVTGAFYNVKINLGSIKDEAYVEETKKTMAEALEKVTSTVDPLVAKVESALE